MRLPLFPLHAVLFPHLPLPLHIFEERYRAMIGDVLADGSPYGGHFVVTLITDGSEVADPRRPALTTAATGTIAEIRHAERFADGRWGLLTVGTARVQVGSRASDGAYVVAEVEQLPEVVGDAGAADLLLPSVQAALDGYLAGVKRFAASAASKGHAGTQTSQLKTSLDEILKPVRLPADPLAASYAVAGMLQIELTRKQRLLEAPDALTRLTAELSLLRRETDLLTDGATSPVIGADRTYNPN